MMKRLFLTMLCVAAILPLAAASENPTMDANDVNALREAAGTHVVVEGIVTSVGSTRDGKLVFINIGAPMKEGFVAIVTEANQDKFPEGFGSYNGQTVRVSGEIELYRENQPQIKVVEPEQIVVVE